jgi:geranylgeranyl diphosphate synthase, type II
MSQAAKTKLEPDPLQGFNELLLLNLSQYRHSTPELLEAATYAVSSPGHRWRPLLFLHIWNRVTERRENADGHLGLVTAIEYVHTASIVLDDLPAMDDGTLRRGQVPCHIKFGQARAILAAIWLCEVAQSLIQEWRSNNEITVDLDEMFKSIKIEMMKGEILDLEGSSDATISELIEKSRLKSGALYGFTASLPANILGLQKTAASLNDFGNYLGIAYQISDDIQDCIATKTEVGKDVGQDERTIPRLFGLGKATELKEHYKEKALMKVQQVINPIEDIANIVEKICL